MRFRMTALFVLALVLVFGCQQQQESTSPATTDTAKAATAETTTTQQQVTAHNFDCSKDHAKDVVVFVELEGSKVNVTPDKAYLYCRDQKIQWYTNGAGLEIEFKANNPKKLTNPPCEKPQGKVPFCGDGWEDEKEGTYEYTARVTDAKGQKHEKDPAVVIER